MSRYIVITGQLRDSTIVIYPFTVNMQMKDYFKRISLLASSKREYNECNDPTEAESSIIPPSHGKLFLCSSTDLYDIVVMDNEEHHDLYGENSLFFF